MTTRIRRINSRVVNPRYLNCLVGSFLVISTLVVNSFCNNQIEKITDRIVDDHTVNLSLNSTTLRTIPPRIIHLQQNSTADRLLYLTKPFRLQTLPLFRKRHRLKDEEIPFPPPPLDYEYEGTHKLVENVTDIDQDCEFMHDWQTSQRPTCNVIHEATYGWDHLLRDDFMKRDMKAFVIYDTEFQQSLEEARLVASGGSRDVWKIRDGSTNLALKTLRMDKDSKFFDMFNFDKHRIDAVAHDRLTSSPLIADMHGYCTNSALFDWGDGGDLMTIFQRDKDISKMSLLQLAYNISLSLVHAQHYDERGMPTIVHSDIKPDQFLFQDGYYKLTDFNRAQFVKRKQDDPNKQCTFRHQFIDGRWRAPEEYKHEPETEKIDVYSLGHVLYFLLVKDIPYHGWGKLETYDLSIKGEKPFIPAEITESHHPYERYMVEAINMCLTYDPNERPGAREVANKLQAGIRRLKMFQEVERRKNAGIGTPRLQFKRHQEPPTTPRLQFKRHKEPPTK